MSLCDNKGVAVYPKQFLEQCVAAYVSEHGKVPKILVVSKDDLIDWTLSSFGGRRPTNLLGMEVIVGDYLKAGEIDLAEGVK